MPTTIRALLRFLFAPTISIGLFLLFTGGTDLFWMVTGTYFQISLVIGLALLALIVGSFLFLCRSLVGRNPVDAVSSILALSISLCALSNQTTNLITYHRAKIQFLPSLYNNCILKSQILANGKRYGLCSGRPSGSSSQQAEIFDEGDELELPAERRSFEWKQDSGWYFGELKDRCNLTATHITQHFYLTNFVCS
jgi:hypothetical protein